MTPPDQAPDVPEQPQAVSYRSRRPRQPTEPEPLPQPDPWWRLPVRHRALLGTGLVTAVLVVLVLRLPTGTGPGALSHDGRTTLVVFVLATWAWACTRVEGVFVALAAATALVVLGAVEAETLFRFFGDDNVWLLLGALLIAAAVGSTGLVARGVGWALAEAGGPRRLVHQVTAVLVLTTLVIPTTAGRSAAVLPVLVAVVAALRGRPRLRRTLTLLIPTVLALSAISALIGAGAHVLTAAVVESSTGQDLSFDRWLMVALPLGLVVAHLAAEVVLAWCAGTRDEETGPLRLPAQVLQPHLDPPLTGPLTSAESRALFVLPAVLTLWCTEPLHGVHPAMVALGGALLITSPRFGVLPLQNALARMPWSLLLFIGAALALAGAMDTTGAASWLAGHWRPAAPGPGTGLAFLVVVVLVAGGSHLVIGSHLARAAVLLPLVAAFAPALQVDPGVAVLSATAALGVGLLPPVTAPAGEDPTAGGDGGEHLPPRLALYLTGLNGALVLVFGLLVWPVFGVHP